MDQDGRGDHEVVSLINYHNDIRFPAANLLRRYWDDLRGLRQVPLRSEVNPRAIEETLEFAFILERIAPGVGRFRLAGMHLSDLMGMEVRGMPLTSVFLPEHRSAISQVLEEVFAGPSTALLSLAGERGIGRPPMEARMLLLPLASDLGDVTRALGCLCTLGPVGRTPRRFRLAQQTLERVDPQRPLPAAPAPTLPQATPQASGFAEPSGRFDGPPPPPRRRKPLLRLVRRDGHGVDNGED